MAVHRLYGHSPILWPFTDFTEQVEQWLRRCVEGCVESMWKVALNLTRKLRLNFQVNLSNSTLGFTANSFNNNNEMLDCRLFRVGSKEIAAPASG